MAYDLTKLTKLSQLKKLAQQVKTSDDALAGRISTLEGAGYQTAQNVTDAINAKVASTYKAGGSVAFADLPALTAANEGKVVNITDTDGFTTTADFIEGSGKKHPAGTNVVIINTGTTEAPVYKYDVLAGFVDLSGYQAKVSGATNGNIAVLDANGQVSDSGSKPSDFLTQHQDISGKADKVSGATADHVATLDADGNLKDGGHALSEYLTQHQDISGKADKDSDAVDGNVAKFDANGNPVDSGVVASKLVTTDNVATDTEVEEMLNEVFNASSEGNTGT